MTKDHIYSVYAPLGKLTSTQTGTQARTCYQTAQRPQFARQSSHSSTDKKNPGLFQDFPGPSRKNFQDHFSL